MSVSGEFLASGGLRGRFPPVQTGSSTLRTEWHPWHWITDPQAWIALLTLTSLEIVLGIDNIIFISILSGRLPEAQRGRARTLGLAAAMVTRILLLASLAWLAHLTRGLFTVAGHEVTARDLVLLGGGLFLLAKATFEIHHNLEGDEGHGGGKAAASFAAVIAQIMVLDIIFSLDSVITAIGMADHLPVMIAAVVIAVLVMMAAAGPISRFVEGHPTVKMLALSFLLLVGMSLIAEGFGQHISKAYIYFAMGFSVFVEMLNLRIRARAGRHPVKLRGSPLTEEGDRRGQDRGRRPCRAIRSCRPLTCIAPGRAASSCASIDRPPSAMRVPAARVAPASSRAPSRASSAAAELLALNQSSCGRRSATAAAMVAAGNPQPMFTVRHPASRSATSTSALRHRVGIADEGAAEGQRRVVPASRQGVPQLVHQAQDDLARAPLLVYRQGAVLPAVAEVRERAGDDLVADLGHRMPADVETEDEAAQTVIVPGRESVRRLDGPPLP